MPLREALSEIIGPAAVKQWIATDGLLWGVASALAMIEGRGGPKSDAEHELIKWWDRRQQAAA